MNQSMKLGLIALVAAAWLGCKTNASVPRNSIPEARAGEDQQLDFDGQPQRVTLDGSGSSDEDGTIAKYIWMSGNGEMIDAAVDRVGPDPEDVAEPTVQLDQGVWSFVLWVEDDEGGVSEPDVVEITVGDVEPTACVPEECTPPLGEGCCTAAETGMGGGDPRGRSPDVCGNDLGSVIPDLAGICLQLDQPGAPDDSCPEINGEPGCCTDEGMCASLNTSAGLGCHYPQEGPGEACEAP